MVVCIVVVVCGVVVGGAHTCSQSAISELTFVILFKRSVTTCVVCVGCKIACKERKGMQVSKQCAVVRQGRV